MRTQRVELSRLETVIASQWKKILPRTDSEGRQVTASFVVTHGGNTAAPDRHQRCVVMELKQVGAVSNSTTCIGVRSNVRVEDNPMVRFSSSSATSSYKTSGVDAFNSDDSSSSGGGKYKYRVGAPADSEVGEYVLRLVVAQLGDSECVFLSLKSILGFAQAFTDYTELKKLHDTRTIAAQRISEMQTLFPGSSGGSGNVQSAKRGDSGLEGVERLFQLYRGASSLTLSERLSPSPVFFESHHAEQRLQGASVGLRRAASLGIRFSVGDYDEACGVYRGLFCRICYAYDCHEHGSEQPQPARRVDPVYPAVTVIEPGQTSVSVEELFLRRMWFDDEGCISSGTAKSGDATNPQDAAWRATSRPATACDPTEYLDVSHVGMATRKITALLDPAVGCSAECWKVVATPAASSNSKRAIAAMLDATEIMLIEKMRVAVGDSACTIASMLRTVPCAVIGAWLAEDGGGGERAPGGSPGDDRRVRQRQWKQKRGSSSRSSSHHELLQRARNHRLQEKQTEHQYEPCAHDGLCDSLGCSCMTRDHMCDKACSCSRDCPNRFVMLFDSLCCVLRVRRSIFKCTWCSGSRSLSLLLAHSVSVSVPLLLCVQYAVATRGVDVRKKAAAAKRARASRHCASATPTCVCRAVRQRWRWRSQRGAGRTTVATPSELLDYAATCAARGARAARIRATPPA